MAAGGGGGAYGGVSITDPDALEGYREAQHAPLPSKKADSPGDWMKKNLFSSAGNTITTIIFAIFGLVVLRWLSGLIFSEERLWGSVWTNMRTLFTFNFPQSQYGRIWFSLGSLLLMGGLTVAAFAPNATMKIRGLLSKLFGAGVLLTIFALVSPDLGDSRVIFALILGLVLAAIGGIAIQAGGFTADDERSITVLQFIMGFAAFVVVAVWLVPFGRFEFADGEVIRESGTVALSTKVPWTIMMGLLAGGIAAGSTLRNWQPLRGITILWWVMGPAFLIFLVLRDPAFDSAHLISTDIPMAAGFAIGGAVLLYFLTGEGLASKAKGVGAVLLAYALFNWVTAFGDLNFPGGITINWQWYPWASPPAGVEGTSMLQKARLSFLFIAMAALLAPNFVGELKTRLRFAGAWVGFMVIFHWLVTAINTPSTLENVAPPFLGGFTLTLSIAYYVMLASFPIGVMMALARTSKLPIFRMLSTVFIEFVRGVPLITVLFFFSNMVNLFLPDGMSLSELGAIFIGYTLFSAAYMAENIRGGLQSVRSGQFEAASALGLTGVQRTTFIVLPQALRVSIPNLVGQAIATFKETSLIFIIGGFDFLRIANASIPSQPDFLGQNLPALLFVSVVYWVISYAMSRGSQNLEKKLGVGDR